MSTINKIVASVCLGLFVATFAACTGVAEIQTVDEADRKLPPAATGDAEVGDPNSGASTSWH